ncbi:MAG TPA: trypsin-like peptidase domain-containing protein [Saprospiraceae bacterium]|nr:trypsin-like peptidase domain-containing protein [Saprospiraceae bacterium]HMP23836.1 trypsin-like peptidase domain-containing protein [Saprospiraceae bacterium]
MKNLRFLLWILIFGTGVLVGLAWKNREIKPDAATNRATATAVNNPDSTAENPNTAANEALSPAEMATIRLFERAAPSVCFITTTNVQYNYRRRDVSEIPRGTGSGFIWDKNGHIITNYHVIRGADRATVTLADRSTWQATLVGKAPEKDLAVLKIEAPREQLIPIPVGTSDDLRVGQNVYAIGNPFGLDQTLTTGIVSALGREIESVAGVPIRDVIQTDAAINPGNSGGPLLNSAGRLIGVNTAIYSPSGASAGIGFSIPVDAVRWVVPELIQYGEIKRPSLGLEVARPQLVKRLGLEGALVLSVEDGGAAERAGIRPTYRNRNGEIILGDIIVSIGNEVIKTGTEISLALEKYQPGEVVTVRLSRNGEQVEARVKLDPPR